MTIGQRIREARTLRGIERKDLATTTKIPYPTLAGIENGDQASSTRLHAIAAALRVNVRWLETGKGERDATEAANDDGWPEVIAYDQGASLGEGISPEEYQETHRLKFRAESLRRQGLNASRCAVYYGRGDSMEPRIKDGDAILFNTAETDPVDDAIFVVRYDGHEYCKRLRELGGQWFMASDNMHDPKWRKPRLIDPNKHFEVLGRVRWIGSWED